MSKIIPKLIATTLGAGYFPVGPGTMGALVGAVIVWLFGIYNVFNFAFYELNALLIILIIIFGLLGVWSTNQLESEWGKDPGKIVMDETVGVWITCLFVPMTISTLIAAFILFRIFDIWKPLGIKKFEALKGGVGVMMDDVVAGIYSNIVLQIIVFSGLI